jgi:DNA polymerase I-like protein with 3'-5' exonuclease and polymerase domains
MMNSILVTYKSTRNAYQAKQWLESLSKYPTIACDFEVALRYTSKELQVFNDELNDESTSYLRKRQLQALLKASALDHVSHTTITHLSVAWSDSDAYVFIVDSIPMQNLLLRFLVSTPIQQIWHNASFDFRHIHYYTNKFPPNYDDSQILAKTLINHVETYKAKTGLKELAGYKYGSWGISADNFSLEQMYEPHVLKYAATDACATFWLWSYLQDYLKEPRNG